MENYYNHKFAVFPAAVPVRFQSLGLVAKPENQNGPRTDPERNSEPLLLDCKDGLI